MSRPKKERNIVILQILPAQGWYARFVASSTEVGSLKADASFKKIPLVCWALIGDAEYRFISGRIAYDGAAGVRDECCELIPGFAGYVYLP